MRDIKYIEVRGHYLFYHARAYGGEGEFIVQTRGIMRDVEAELADCHFVRCSISYLVHLDFVDSVGADGIRMGRRAASRQPQFPQAGAGRVFGISRRQRCALSSREASEGQCRPHRVSAGVRESCRMIERSAGRNAGKYKSREKKPFGA